MVTRNRFWKGFLGGLVLATIVSVGSGLPNGAKVGLIEAGQGKPKGVFVNLVTFPPIRPGKDAEFREWFRWSNAVYAKHEGFLSRTLLKPMDPGGTYAAIVEHDSKETFMTMHHSQDREEAFKRVQPLLDGRPTPHFYEVVIFHGK